MIAAPYVELLVEQQARRWQLRRDQEGEHRPRQVIALSRLPGAHGEEVARRLSETLGYDLFDQALIQQVAENAHLSERVVAALDEKDRSWLSEWLVSFAMEGYLSTYEYLHQLRKVIGAIARHGSAVIVGRGAHLILGPQALRILVLAPASVRVANMAASRAVTEREARRLIAAEEAAREAFLARHFHGRLGNPEEFDLAVNTHALGVDGAVKTVQAALEHVPVHPAARGGRPFPPLSSQGLNPATASSAAPARRLSSSAR